MRDKIDKILFFLFQHLPQKLIPSAVMNWMIQYVTRRNVGIKTRYRKDTMEQGNA